MLSMSAHMNIGWRWIGDSRNLGVGCRSIVRAGSLVQLSSSVYAGTKTEEDEKSEVIFGHAKRSKNHTMERVCRRLVVVDAG